MSQEAKVIAGIVIATIVIIVGAAVLLGNPSPSSDQTNISGDKQSDRSMLVGETKNRIGTDSAKVEIVEFGDFQCPACGAAHPIVKSVIDKNSENVTFVFRHFPLPSHKNAMNAAKAAEAAATQGKFWEMHDMLYERQAEWENSASSKDVFTDYANQLGLDLTAFAEDFESEAISEKIQQEQNAGITLGVNSTPTFFINGEKAVGVLSEAEFQSKIDAAVK